MRYLVLALALTMATPARAGANFEAFATGVITAILINAYIEDEETRSVSKSAVVIPPPPPVRLSPKDKYMESCQGHGFSSRYCDDIWEGRLTPVK
jgi:hypothetical protein